MMQMKKVYITNYDLEVLQDCYSAMVDNELDVECYKTRNLMKSLKIIIKDLKEEVHGND